MAREFGRWFRFYDAVLDDPKVQQLSDPMFRAWVNLMCLASRGGGHFADDMAQIAFALRVTKGQASKLIAGLIDAGLLERSGPRFEPHNWSARQFKSDVSTERVKRFRERYMQQDRNAERNGRRTVSETAPDTETDQNQKQRLSCNTHVIPSLTFEATAASVRETNGGALSAPVGFGLEGQPPAASSQQDMASKQAALIARMTTFSASRKRIRAAE